MNKELKKMKGSTIGWIIVLFGLGIATIGAGIDTYTLQLFMSYKHPSLLYWLIVFLHIFGALIVGYGFAFVQINETKKKVKK